MGYFRDNVERVGGYTPGFQPKATDVVKLNTNENPYPPSPEVMKALAGIGPEQLRHIPIRRETPSARRPHASTG